MRVRVFGIFPAVTENDPDSDIFLEKHWINDYFGWLFGIFCFFNVLAAELQGVEPSFWMTVVDNDKSLDKS